MNLQKAITVLRSGGVLAHATETCYGFACDAFNKKALSRLYKLKQMDSKKPVSIMVSNLKMAKKYGFFSKKAQVLAKKYWPGPLTIIVERKKSLPHFLNPHIKTIGFRVPKHKLSTDLVKKFGSPLITTSANISGQPSPYSATAIRIQFRRRTHKPGLILNSGQLKKIPPSSVIDMSIISPKIKRQGSVWPLLS